MANSKPAGLNPFTVICRWHSGEDACDPWQTVAIALSVVGDAEETGALYDTVEVVEM
ncbi:MAG: hypothetical protein MUE94_01400 [Verrucomicrobia bacterium]|jgi:hypothetical protein|nr:hypothetical protein [Verrucomicrobiota bacterium]